MEGSPVLEPRSNTSGGSIAERLHAHRSPDWDAATGHPMVRDLASGTLPHASFRRYFEQNIAYLEDYTRAIGAIAVKAPDASALEILGRVFNQITTVELPANRDFLARLGGDPGAPRAVATMEPATYAYTRHLLATATLGDCAAGLVAILPCQWSYGEIGRDLSSATPGDAIYEDWIAVFGDPAYDELVAVTTGLLDRVADDSDAGLQRLQVIFDVSTRFEVGFWDMAYGAPPRP